MSERVRLDIRLPQDLSRRISVEAVRRGIDVATLMRTAIEMRLAQEDPVVENRTAETGLARGEGRRVSYPEEQTGERMRPLGIKVSDQVFGDILAVAAELGVSHNKAAVTLIKAGFAATRPAN